MAGGGMLRIPTQATYQIAMNEKEIEGFCPTCKADKWSWIKAEHTKHDRHEEYGMWWDVVHRILECKSCETAFYQREETNSEDMHQWYDHEGMPHGEYIQHFSYFPPKPRWPRPSWSDQIAKHDTSLENILTETYTAFEHELYILAAIGIRTALDRMSEMLDIDPSLSFGNKLKELVNLGRITEDEQKELNILIDAGNAAAHRGWEPNEGELRKLLQYLELFISKILIPTPSLASLKNNLPPDQRKAKKEPTL